MPGNNYEKRDIRLLNVSGLVIGVQPEGLAEGVFTVLNNTHIYKKGAIGLRNQRDLFAGLVTTGRATPTVPTYTSNANRTLNLGRGLWFQHITRFDKDYIIGFAEGSLYAWPYSIPDPSFSGTPVLPTTSSLVSFKDFLPTSQIPTTVSVLPEDRSIPVTYFLKPGAERMYKLVATTRGGADQADGKDDTAGEPTTTSEKLAVFYWGINAPTGRPLVLGVTACAKGLTPSTTSGATTYDWVWTYCNSETGHEGNPSSGLKTRYSTASAKKAARIKITVDTGGDPQIDTIRLYRQGGLNPYYTRTKEFKLADAQWITGTQDIEVLDDKADSEISLTPQLKIDNFVPFVSTNQAGDAVYNATASFIFGPFADRVILAIGEKNQPGNVFWTNTGRADSSSAINNVQVTSGRDPLLTGLIYNGVPYVASRGDWYALDYQTSADGNAVFTSRRTQAGKGPIGPWAAASGDYVYFITQDGVMQTDGQSPARSISEDINIIFHNQSTPEYAAIDFSAAQEMFRLYWAAPELHFIYPDTTNNLNHMVYDGNKWRSEEFARPGMSEQTPTSPWDNASLMHTTCIYHDVAWPARSVLLGTDSKAIFVQRPYQSSGLEVAKFRFNGTDDWKTTSTAGWVTGHFRTHTDDYNAPALIKEIGNISFEGSLHGTQITDATINAYGTAQGAFIDPTTSVTPVNFFSRAKLTPYVNVESGLGTLLTSPSPTKIEPVTATTTGQPIGSDVYNLTIQGRQRFPFGLDPAYHFVYSTAWDFQFIGPWNFHNLTVMWHNDTEVVTHWHQCNLGNGADGWSHVRDGYIDARLYGTATLNLAIDTDDVHHHLDWPKLQTQTFSPIITEQSGEIVDYTGLRNRYYFSLDPMKGKKFTWTLDCPQGMRLYSEGSSTNVKQWVTGSGYRSYNPWADGVV